MLPPGEQQLTVRVVDPTAFVRDPAIRDTVLTATRTWTVSADTRPKGIEPTFTAGFAGSTQTARPIGGTDVVYIEGRPPVGSEVPALATARWRLDNAEVVEWSNRLTVDLGSRKLSPGTHTLTATVGLAITRNPANIRTWTIDNTMPTVDYGLSKPVAGLPIAAGAEPHLFMRDEFTMKLAPKDDQPGYVVAEFRLNGDGWHHYYGWPDAPPGTPFKFTPRGTNIKELIYGSLSSEGLSPQPWEPREPGWGSHRIEYRAKDAAGNIGPAKSFRVTVMPSTKCDTTITGQRTDPLRVEGVTCLDGATMTSSIIVNAGATLIAVNSKISGSVSANSASTIELVNTSIDGRLQLVGTTERVTIFGVTVGQDAIVSDSRTKTAPLVIGSTIKGSLSCAGNAVPVSNGGSKNTAKAATGQCADR